MTQQSKTPRVRFAPSPTGRLHVGGARTALFNWLFARHQEGTFVLRIEDTDAARSTRESEESLLEDLAWLGLDWDEGPDVGGAFGPYRQSERGELYKQQADLLVQAGKAYPCFCSDDELASKREKQLSAGRDPHYDGSCRDLSPTETAAKVPQQEHTIRFKLPTGVLRFSDHIRGEMAIQTKTLGDFVLLRSSGLPTYNFACVVDDSHMQITHVVRGEDHLYNTARQVALYDGMKLEMPEFAHLSLILGEDRSKLKKRDGKDGTFVDGYRQHGVLPLALVNFLALLGWSSPSGKEVLSRDTLIQEFDLSRVAKSPAVFDVQKLSWMSGEHLRLMEPQELLQQALPFLASAGLSADAEQSLRWIAAFQDRITSLDELPTKIKEVLEPGPPEEEARMALLDPAAKELMKTLADRLAEVLSSSGELDGQMFKQLLKESGKVHGVKGRGLFMPARAALSGTSHGPDLPLLFGILTPAEAIHRIRTACE